jgi:hypothetical protein
MPTASALIGYIASGLVLTTFWTNDLRRLRMLAILSNIAFISYGALVWLPPVMGLHLLLLPLNALRLMRMSATAPRAEYRKLLLAKVSMLLDRVPCSGALRRRLPNEEIAGARPATFQERRTRGQVQGLPLVAPTGFSGERTYPVGPSPRCRYFSLSSSSSAFASLRSAVSKPSVNQP